MSIIENILRSEIVGSFKKPLEVMAILQDYYGQDNVDIVWVDIDEVINKLVAEDRFTNLSEDDLHVRFPDGILYGVLKYFGYRTSPEIIVYLPEVKITNEYGESSVIKDVFVRIVVSTEGKLVGTLSITRSTLSVAEFMLGYVHPHVPLFSGMPTFSSPCLGVGPLVDTIPVLNTEFDEGMWRVFCVQLHEFLQTESVKGGPYLRQSSVGVPTGSVAYKDINPIMDLDGFYSASAQEGIIVEFVDWLIDNANIEFAYKNGSFRLGMPIDECALLISNLFIQWVNSTRDWKCTGDLTHIEHMLMLCAKKDGRFVRYGNSWRNALRNNGDVMFLFRGKPVHLLVESYLAGNSAVRLLNPPIVSRILYTLLNIINITYESKFNGKAISCV